MTKSYLDWCGVKHLVRFRRGETYTAWCGHTGYRLPHLIIPFADDGFMGIGRDAAIPYAHDICLDCSWNASHNGNPPAEPESALRRFLAWILPKRLVESIRRTCAQ